MQRESLAALADERYISLTTYRRDGRAVATPVWFALDGPRLVVWTGATTGKAKRIRNNPCVLVASCTARGAVTGNGFSATAQILPDTEAQRVRQLLQDKYRMQKRALDAFNTLVRLLRCRPHGASVYLSIMAAPTATESGRESSLA